MREPIWKERLVASRMRSDLNHDWVCLAHGNKINSLYRRLSGVLNDMCHVTCTLDLTWWEFADARMYAHGLTELRMLSYRQV